MKRFNKIAVCLAGGLAMNAGLRAETAPTTGNPYAMVVTRNIFGLNPPVLPDSNPAPVEPPVKITLNGIMDVFGQVKALYKVAGKTPGKDESYMLTEGQGKDDIEVVKIDEKKGEVTFNNHGLEQIVPLAAASASSLPAATAAVAGNFGIPGIPGAAPSGTPFVASGFNTAFGGRAATSVSTPAPANVPGIRPIATRPAAAAASQQPSMTPAEQVVVMEVNRELTKQQVIDGTMPPLPPTPLTPEDATGVGGAPLVTPPPLPQK